MQLSTPVLFLIFNRPIQTALVFEAIREARPSRLFVAADGPRKDVVDEREKCEETRKIVLQSIDWPCEINTLLRDENLGCGKAVSNAITWFFENVDEGIILEDDCLPDQSFFFFCEQMLEKYRYNKLVMHIGGSSFQELSRKPNSYYFSRYIFIWGWATWKRAWDLYDFNLNDNEIVLKHLVSRNFKDTYEASFWKDAFQAVIDSNIDTWDYQWTYTILKNEGLGITPNLNLVNNIGFGPLATHTLVPNDFISERKRYSIKQIDHPRKVKIHERADYNTYKRLYQFGNTRFNRMKFAVGKRFPFIKTLYLKGFKK
ncbi:nucleotide-diphospho-sugar transferase [Mucilaginibacter pallidiroseus]|uniref:Nucleotide-diphospho-sugar transferase n=1 Tax=Mucilaginibacter pallidiroseus TaxID=2599295 RepID=A0A563U1Y6_9SPHI|nr:nucleotide-diphospho-sugar transferase [Mucilaginibacter pallidiroseus]TWR25182.1 nucleotide-diphospho-sugar transferase [Mucilaginibacter pallidiroseus]